MSYKIDLHFPEHRLAIEVDEKGHSDWDVRKENEREKKLVVNSLELILMKESMMRMLNLVK